MENKIFLQEVTAYGSCYRSFGNRDRVRRSEVFDSSHSGRGDCDYGVLHCEEGLMPLSFFSPNKVRKIATKTEGIMETNDIFERSGNYGTVET